MDPLELLRLGRDDLRALLDGDMVFCFADDGGDGDDGDGDGDDGDGDDGDGDDELISREEARKLRSERKNLRKRLRDTEKERDRLKNDGLSEAEQRKNDLESERRTTSELRETNRKLQVQVLATKVGIVDPEAASALIDWDGLGDDADDPKALERELKDLKKRKPWLAAQGGSDDGGENGADGGAGRGKSDEPTDMNKLLFGPLARSR
jgi:hypothetical protein